MTQSSYPSRPRSLVWWEIVVAILVGYLAFLMTGAAIVWVVAGIVSGWVVCRVIRWRKHKAEPSRRIRTMGQSLVGAALGPALAVQDFSGVGTNMLAILVAVVLVLLGSVATAHLYFKWFGVDRLTAGLATLPGGLSVMPAIAAEYNRPPGLVALVQAARIAVIIFSIPLIAPLIGEVASSPVEHLVERPDQVAGWAFWVGLLGLTPLAAIGARKARIPVAALLGPMFASMGLTTALRLGGVDLAVLHVPFSQEVIGQVFLGITVGEYLAQKFRYPRRQILGGFISVLGTFSFCIVLATALWLATPWSFITCLLSVAPGGAPEMVVVAAAVDADLHIVVLTQIIRQIAVSSLMPFWLWLFERRGGSGQPIAK